MRIQIGSLDCCSGMYCPLIAASQRDCHHGVLYEKFAFEKLEGELKELSFGGPGTPPLHLSIKLFILYIMARCLYFKNFQGRF